MSISRGLGVKARKPDDCSSGKLGSSITCTRVTPVHIFQILIARMSTLAQAAPHAHGWSRTVSLLLNIGHGIDHMFLLIFATAVATVAVEFGYANWEDLMPYSVGAFALFGLGALPGRPPRRPVGTARHDDHLLRRHGRRGDADGADAERVAARGGTRADRRVRRRSTIQSAFRCSSRTSTIRAP